MLERRLLVSVLTQVFSPKIASAISRQLSAKNQMLKAEG
jgi:hypothetical protein